MKDLKNTILFSLGEWSPSDEIAEANGTEKPKNQFDDIKLEEKDFFGEEPPLLESLEEKKLQTDENLNLTSEEPKNEELKNEEETSKIVVLEKKDAEREDSLFVLAQSMKRMLDILIENKDADKNVVNGVTDAMNKLANAQGGAGRVYSRPAVEYSNIDVEDSIKPVTFFAWSISKNIFDDFKNGVAIMSPYGAPIKFSPFTQIKTKGSNDKSTKTNSMSTVQIYSKRQLEFLRNHSEFGITFFETISDAIDVSPDKADALQQASEFVKNLTDYQVKQRCLTPGSGIKIDSMDMSVLRKSLIKKLAQEYKPEQEAIQKNILEQTLKAKTLIENQKA